MITCYILDEFGTTESAATVETATEAFAWFHERNIAVQNTVLDGGVFTASRDEKSNREVL